MKKQELLKMMDEELLEKLYGFCYARTSGSYEAQELCSDIIFELVKAANGTGDIEHPYPFIWRVARNVYAGFSDRRRRHKQLFYEGDVQQIFAEIAEIEPEDDSRERLNQIYRCIAFLTKAYREVMILFYLDGLSTAQIARRLHMNEGTVRQRLFSARKIIRSEVTEMEKNTQKPIALDNINYVLWGTGQCSGNDPRDLCEQRQFSKHVIYLCHKKPSSAAEIAAALNVPTLYVEEELDILEHGKNGQYGLLRKVDRQNYALNFVLFDQDTMEQANAVYLEQMPAICGIINDFIEQQKDEYLAFPYLNKKYDLNLILWQQLHTMAYEFQGQVEKILSKNYFSQTEKIKRPFSIFGYVDHGTYYGAGHDDVSAQNVCGFSQIYLNNIYISRINQHFDCNLNVAKNREIQLALQAIDGLPVSSLSEQDREHAAKAIESGYLYREGDWLYTGILVHDLKDEKQLFEITKRLSKGYFETEAQTAARQLYHLIRTNVPKHLLGEWRFANALASLPIVDALAEVLIEKGLLIPPAHPLGPEGCWMGVSRSSE